MYYRFPIEQIARTCRMHFQNGFARMAMYLLPKLEDVMYEPTNFGLRILGSDESALAVPADILMQTYGEDVELAKPRVRMLRDADGGLKEPVMNVRISTPPSSAQRVVDDLSRRESFMQEVDEQPAATVIRAQAPLRTLLGYQQSLAAMTANTAELWLWLSHYEKVKPPDGDAA